MRFVPYVVVLIGLVLLGSWVTSPHAAEKNAAAKTAPEAADDAEEADDDDDEEQAELQLDDPRDILDLYAPFEVNSRVDYLTDELAIYPCSDCHDESQIANPKVRTLTEEHFDLKLRHGRGRFWCMTCHDLKNRDTLTSMKGQPIGFDDSYLVCGQCHFQRQRDFFFGAHGKRVEGWQDDKVIATCVECHNPHDPRIPARQPVGLPTLRPGLPQADVERHHPLKPWEKVASDRGIGQTETKHEREH